MTDAKVVVDNEVVEAADAALTADQEIFALRKVHEFLREFDRVPGALSGTWSQMLDTVAKVANSLISKLPKVDDSKS